MPKISMKRLRIYWIVAALIAVAMVAWVALDMVQLSEERRLWGYRPLPLLFWGWCGVTFLWHAITGTKTDRIKNYFYGSIAAILLGLAFPPLPFLLLVIPAWALLFELIRRTENESNWYRFRLFFHVFMLWNIITTYWVSNTAFMAGIVAMVANSFLMCLPVLLFIILKSKVRPNYHMLLFIACWLSFEFFHFRWEAHWPWLTLGHYLMDIPFAIQWYSITGVAGGSVLILTLSWLFWKLMQERSHRKRRLIRISVLFILPLVVSLIMSQSPTENKDTIKVGVVQPNHEPHYVKDNISTSQSLNQFFELSNEIVDSTTDYLIFPETSFRLNLNEYENNNVVRYIDNYLDKYPDLTIISGMSSFRILSSDDVHDKYTRTFIQNQDTTYWESHNSAMCFQKNSGLQIYYKSKLVPGAEFFPFKDVLFFMKPLMDKLGGSGSGLRAQEERSNFSGGEHENVAPVICYESVFGEYVSEYVKKGATWIAVMTNDGWWDNTAGHKQHLGLSRIRAIEQRKWIARAANSGISCFIDPRGKIYNPTNYNEATSISKEIDPNNVQSFYAKAGDFIHRLALLFLIGMLLRSILKRIKEKN